MVIVVAGPVVGSIFGIESGHSHQLTAKRKLFFPVTVAKKAIVADALESIGQDMNQETANEFLRR